MDPHDNVQAIIDTAELAASGQPLDGATRFYLSRVEDEGVVITDLEALKYDEERRQALDVRPERKDGTSQVEDAASFLHVWGKEGMATSELWANRANATLSAIFNASEAAAKDDEGEAGWRDHRAVLQLVKTDQWKAWEAVSGKAMRQTQAAEFIEDRAPDFTTPTGATLLEIAQSIRATKGVKFESTQRLSNGETSLQYTEAIEAKAGKRGTLAIPDTVKLLLQPYEGGPAYNVEARFRYRIDDGDLLLSFVLTRPADVLRDAFGAVVDEVAKGVGETPIVYGRPA